MINIKLEQRNLLIISLIIGLIAISDVFAKNNQVIWLDSPSATGIVGIVKDISDVGFIKITTTAQTPYKQGDRVKISIRNGKIFIISGEYQVVTASNNLLIISPSKVFEKLHINKEIKIISSKKDLKRKNPIITPNPGAIGNNPINREGVTDRSSDNIQKSNGYEKCLQNCIYSHQMMAIELKLIEKNCQNLCNEKINFKKALIKTKSANPETYKNGILELCDIKDKKRVPVLIKALEREFQERRGLWPWIIPALGKSNDKSAIPVLIKALTLNDPTWLGRVKAAEALGELKAEDAIPVLLKASMRCETRYAALEALSNFKKKIVVSYLIDALSEGEEQDIRDLAFNSLKNMAEFAVPELIKEFSVSCKNSEYKDIKKILSLCHLLGQSGDYKAILTLKTKCKLNDPYLNKCIALYSDNFSREFSY